MTTRYENMPRYRDWDTLAKIDNAIDEIVEQLRTARFTDDEVFEYLIDDAANVERVATDPRDRIAASRVGKRARVRRVMGTLV